MQTDNEKIEELLKLYTAETGLLDRDTFYDALAQWGCENRQQDWHQWARQLFEAYKNRHTLRAKPKGTDPSQMVFGFEVNLKAVVPLSDGPKAELATVESLRLQMIDRRIAMIAKKAAEVMSSVSDEISMLTSVKEHWTPLAKKIKTFGELLKHGNLPE